MNEQEHAAALARIEVLMESDPPPDTSEGAELNALADAVVEYEKRFFSLPNGESRGHPPPT